MSYEDIVKLFAETDERLRLLIRQLEDGHISARRIDQLSREIESIVSELAEQAGMNLSTLIGNEYSIGAQTVVNQIVTTGITQTVISSVKSLHHQQAAQAIMDEAFYSILEVTDYMAADAKQRIKKAVQSANEKSLVLGIGRREATKQAIVDVNSKGITGIIAKNGAEIPADKYMAGVVHYHQRKAHVTGGINMAMQNGYDLVFVNYVGITCEHCARLQGRVYSLSGNDPRFPKMLDEYKPPYHSHCVHSISVWVEEYQSEDEIKRMIELSNRLGAETRSEHHIKRYKELQRKKAQANETRKQWMRYKAVLPSSTPDLRTFASQKARGTQNYKDLQDMYKEANRIIKSSEVT
jgi:hypothetical protein